MKAMDIRIERLAAENRRLRAKIEELTQLLENSTPSHPVVWPLKKKELRIMEAADGE